MNSESCIVKKGLKSAEYLRGCIKLKHIWYTHGQQIGTHVMYIVNVDTHTDVDVYLTKACTVLAQSVGDGPITTIG